MPIIGNVGRRSYKVRFLNTLIHVVLLLGAVTMIYPFMVMLSGSVKSQVDSKTLSAVPAYFFDETWLYRKWIEAKYNETLGNFSLAYRERPATFAHVNPAAKPSVCRNDDWLSFISESDDKLNEYHSSLGFAYGIGVKPEMQRIFVRELKAEPDVKGDINKLNAKYGTIFVDWEAIGSPTMGFLLRESSGQLSPFTKRVVEFEQSQPSFRHTWHSLDSLFVDLALRPEFAQGVAQMNEVLGTDYVSWSDVHLSRTPPTGVLRGRWEQFVRFRLHLYFVSVADSALPAYQDFLRGKYADIKLLNERYGTNFTSFSEVQLLREVPRGGVKLTDWDQFVSTIVKLDDLGVRGLDFMYRDFLREKYETIEELNAAQDQGLQGLEELALTEDAPVQNTAWSADWIEFVRGNIVKGWVRPDSGARRDWLTFLTKPYMVGEEVNIDELNADLGTNYEDDSAIAIPLAKPAEPALAERWMEFVENVCPPELLRVNVPAASGAWTDYIKSKYSDVAELNRKYRLAPRSFDEVNMPAADADWFAFVANKRDAFWEFVTRNYAIVLQTMLYNGRAMINTVIYCFLAVLVALIVNPLAAYALSRYKPPSQYKLLLLLMLTMAFPPMVLGIPNFLLLRKLGLLNTFAALVLPGMANGYMIFILKGFFDSLPRELYESAQIDGASEWTMFWRITMSTSTPILAVIALSAFVGAYGNFMLAFIVCQNPKMWTMMVHIYQLQGRSSQSVNFASLVIAAIPTLLVFIFCQNIIMRGIVVPTEK